MIKPLPLLGAGDGDRVDLLTVSCPGDLVAHPHPKPVKTSPNLLSLTGKGEIKTFSSG